MKFVAAAQASSWSQHTAPTSLTSDSTDGNTCTTRALRFISASVLSWMLFVLIHLRCSGGKSR